MYEPSGNETVVRMRNPEGSVHTLALDDEDYAHLLNEGWHAEEEVSTFFREPIPEEEFIKRDSEMGEVR